ncbi:O-antigen ligase family protein [Lentibacillus sp. N15]
MKITREKWIFLLIIIQPLIDIATSIASHYGISLTFGSLTRAIMMIGLYVWLLRYIYLNKPKLMVPFLVSYAAIVLMLLITFLYKSHLALFQEINFASKTGYYLVMLHVSILLFKQKQLAKVTLYNAIFVVSLIVGSSYWLAIATGSSLNSYHNNKAGFSGWFFSANELSVILLVLLGLSLVHLWYVKTFRTWLAVALLMSMVPMIGTKTAFIGGTGLLIVYMLSLILAYRSQIWREKGALIFLGMGILFLCFVPQTPSFSSTEQTQQVQNAEHVSYVDQPAQPVSLLSSRDIYLQETRADFTNAPVLRKLFGLGLAGDYKSVPKLIEMDFFDLFFGYGIIGSFLLIMPLLYLITRVCTGLFPFTVGNTVLTVMLGMCLGIAFLAGHVLFAPSVMTYVSIGIIALGMENSRGEKIWRPQN